MSSPPLLTTMGSSTTYSSSDKQYNLRWHDYPQSVVSSFRNLKDEEDFVDVTLACNTQQFTAHKVVLSACSPYFRRLLKSNPCQHPIVILRDVTEDDLRSLLKFMYNGEVQIAEERLKDFLRTAETLQVRGLSDGDSAEEGQQCQKTSSTSAISTTMDHDGGTDYSGPPLAKRHRGMNGGSSVSSPMPSSPAGSNNNEQQENNNLTKESLLSQALEKPPLRLPHEEDSASDAMSDRPDLDKSQDSHPGLSSPATAPPPPHSAPNNSFFPPGLEALYRQAGFPAFMGLGAPPGGGGSNHGMPIPGLATSVPSVGLQSHANNPTIGGKLDMMRVRATDPRPCPKCGKIYRSAHTLRTHMEDKHTICPGYRCVLCGTVAKSRNSLHSHMSRQHRGISTKDLPVVPMPAPFDAELASRLLAKAGVKVSPSELAARASPTAPRRSDLPKLDSNFLQSQGHHQFPLPPSMPVGGGGGSDPEDLRVPSSSPFSTASGGGGTMTASAAHMARSLNPKDFAMGAAGAAAAAAAGGMGSTLLDTYLSMIAAAGGDSNMAAAALNLQSGRAAAFAAAAAAASGDRTNGDNKSDIAEDDGGGELGSDAENDISDNEESKHGGDN